MRDVVVERRKEERGRRRRRRRRSEEAQQKKTRTPHNNVGKKAPYQSDATPNLQSQSSTC